MTLNLNKSTQECCLSRSDLHFQKPGDPKFKKLDVKNLGFLNKIKIYNLKARIKKKIENFVVGIYE